jgi:hypothetical protein
MIPASAIRDAPDTQRYSMTDRCVAVSDTFQREAVDVLPDPEALPG